MVSLTHLVAAAVLAFCPQLSLAQNEISTPGPSCSPHPADALQCAYINGTVVGSPCLTGSGVFCCSVASDCMMPSSSSTGSASSSSARSSSATSSALPAASQSPGTYSIAGKSCMARSAAYSPQCVPDSYINGTLDPSLESGLLACFTRSGTLCCRDAHDCTPETSTETTAAPSSRATGSTASSAPVGSKTSIGGGSSQASNTASIPKFTNEAVAGNGIAAAAVAGVLGAAVAFI